MLEEETFEYIYMFRVIKKYQREIDKFLILTKNYLNDKKLSLKNPERFCQKIIENQEYELLDLFAAHIAIKDSLADLQSKMIKIGFAIK